MHWVHIVLAILLYLISLFTVFLSLGGVTMFKQRLATDVDLFLMFVNQMIGSGLAVAATVLLLH